MFVVLVVSKAVTTLTKEGQRFWAIRDIDNWVEATSAICDDKNLVPADAKVWATPEEAEAFAKRWKGHPWWCVPNGEYEVLKVKPKFRSVPDGYTRVKE